MELVSSFLSFTPFAFVVEGWQILKCISPAASGAVKGFAQNFLGS
jgi:hypothetical protein